MAWRVSDGAIPCAPPDRTDGAKEQLGRAGRWSHTSSKPCENAVWSSASGCEGVSNEYSDEEIKPVTGLGRPVGAPRQGGGGGGAGAGAGVGLPAGQRVPVLAADAGEPGARPADRPGARRGRPHRGAVRGAAGPDPPQERVVGDAGPLRAGDPAGDG